MKTQSHLSLFGIGPLFTAMSALLTLAACLLDRQSWIARLAFPFTTLALKIISLACLVIALVLWISAVFVQKIDRNILDNKLVTIGAYAWVRNPIYSAIMLIMWAILFWRGNLYLLLLCPVYPLVMTFLLKRTEEKWLSERYGQAYHDYCQQVHRCFPWFPRTKNHCASSRNP